MGFSIKTQFWIQGYDYGAKYSIFQSDIPQFVHSKPTIFLLWKLPCSDSIQSNEWMQIMLYRGMDTIYTGRFIKYKHFKQNKQKEADNICL